MNFARVDSASPNARPASSSRTAMSVSTEKARGDSVVDIVPMADDRRPEKGEDVGPPRALHVHVDPAYDGRQRVDERRRLDRVRREHRGLLAVPGRLDHVDDFLTCSNSATGTTGPNCSSWKRRIDGVTGYTRAGW